MRTRARSLAVLTSTATASLVAAAAVATAGTASATATAATAAVATSAGSHQVTLTLASRRGQAGLTDIARAAAQKLPTGAARAAAVQTRRAQLAADAPAGGDLAAVTAFAAHNHLTVASHTDWTVTVNGDPATLASLFATSLTPTADGVRASGALAVPAGLADVVTSASGLDDTAHQRPLDAFPPPTHAGDGWGFTPSTITAHNGGLAGLANADGHGVGIGIVNFSDGTAAEQGTDGFSPSEWQTYANAAGVTSQTPVLVSADGTYGTATAASSGSQTDTEVALDTETVTGVAPAAQEYLVTAGNTNSSAIDEYNKLADLAVAGQIQVISSSWGDCEPDYDSSDITAIHQAIARAVAAGATILSASGDSGAYDCYPDNWLGTSTRQGFAVDYPGSDPLVLSVGGTNSSTSGVANDSTWDTISGGPEGSGGGTSVVWSRPSFQAGSGLRLVPDLSADADPDTGLPVYQDFEWFGVGGTSLATPLIASWIADSLSSTIPAGQHLLSGDGDIHALLYAGASTLFNDVTLSNDTSPGYDGWTWPATTGFDRSTGLGTPKLPAFGAALAAASHQISAPAPAPTTAPATTPVISVSPPLPALDRTAPSVGATLTQTAHKGQLVATVAATDTGSGLAGITATIRDADTGTTVLTLHSPGTFTVTVPGGRYVLTVSATDESGNAAAPVTSKFTVGYDDTKLSRSGKWSVVKSSKDFNGSASKSSTKGAAVTLKLTAGSSGKLSVVSLGSGTVTVTVDGKAKTVHLHSGTVAVGTYKTGKHTIKVAVSSGTVTIDALSFA